MIPVLLISITSFGQGRYSYSDTKKGQLTVSFGWNRAFYTKSNIDFKGADYDFKLFQVKAHDRPSLPVNYNNYLRFSRVTAPQTNIRISYFIKEGLAVSLGDDHMKYVMDKDQSVMINGVINKEGPYKGTYDKSITLSQDFLTFEHTNGLNYLNVELEKYFTWYHSNSNQCIVSGMIGGGAGILVPKTDVKLLNYERNDRYHVSGFGLAAKAAVQATFFKHLVVKAENKLGYISMPDIAIHKKGIIGKAKQDFFFAELYVTLGATFSLAGARKRRSNKKSSK